MKRIVGLSALLGLIVGVPYADAQDKGSKDARMARLEAGEVIVTAKKKKGSAVPRVKAIGLIKAPPEKVWAIIDKCDDYSKTMPRTLESKELSRKGDTVQCEVVIDMPFPLGDLRVLSEAKHTVVAGKKWQRRWKGIGGDLKVNEGSWTLVPFNGGKHTVATYKVRSQPKVAIPESIQKMAQQKTIPQLFAKLRKQVE